ncbi:MAG TPA: hypothetical protein VHB79_27445 [Polyangiaceae bacterium]|nr:hypothetical protein [Polyangiaceae bacterium]
MARLLATAVGLFGLGVLLTAGCSGSSFTEGGAGSSGSSATAGTSSSGGTASHAGSSSGGTAAGGTPSDGGTAPGGTDSGGTDTGGTGSGGGATGGTATAGSGGVSVAGSGGNVSGGDCSQDSDCVQCSYPVTPTKASDCCNSCNWMPMTKKECDARRALREKYCANLHPLCPAIACVQPPEALCKDGMCVSGSAP